MKIIKILQKIVGKFLYYYGYIYPTVFVELNSLAKVQTKPTVKTEKQITQFLNYIVTHPEAVT